MKKNEIAEKLEKAQGLGSGDWGRNNYLIERLHNNKVIFNSDKQYLEKLLKLSKEEFDEIYNLSEIKSAYDPTVILNPKLVKCAKCNLEIKLEEKSTRTDSKWYHQNCTHRLSSNHTSIKVAEPKYNKIKISKEKKIRKKPDVIQVLLAATIFVFLTVSVYFILGTLSMIAMGFGGALLLYHLFSAYSNAFSKHKPGRKGPSAFIVFLIITPFAIGSLIAYEGYTIFESPVRIILIWGMTISFWATMLFVPTAVYSKYKEELQPHPKYYPTISVLIPAYNEEKVIANTIEALIETKYPKKEIIFIDDGSKDNTLEIASRYKDKITILHKENGGKASALNYGLVYSKGEVIVIVDADTIIGRNSLLEIIKGFEVTENVAAVAGNIKVRNPINWITKCQSLEYITGIQIVRRAFDIFGTITIVPGALGAFKKKFLIDSGAYQKDTIVEDFDTTIKLLKSGLITQGSTKSTAYTEAPSTLHDFIQQRKRWYRGNIQVLKRHSDALTNPRYGYLQRLAFPYLLLGMLITPIIGFTAAINAIIGTIMGDGLFVLQVFAIFTTVHYLMTALALRIDEEDMKLLGYAGFLVIGFKQITDFLLLKAITEQIFKTKATWTSAKRTGVKQDEIK